MSVFDLDVFFLMEMINFSTKSVKCKKKSFPIEINVYFKDLVLKVKNSKKSLIFPGVIPKLFFGHF